MALPFGIHTPTVQDFGVFFYRGSVDFKCIS